MGSCYGSQERFCAKKGKDISVVKNRERESTEIHKELVKKGVYLTIKITTDITDVFCTEEEWK